MPVVCTVLKSEPTFAENRLCTMSHDEPNPPSSEHHSKTTQSTLPMRCAHKMCNYNIFSDTRQSHTAHHCIRHIRATSTLTPFSILTNCSNEPSSSFPPAGASAPRVAFRMPCKISCELFRAIACARRPPRWRETVSERERRGRFRRN